ncbi:MAG: iron-containing alcohol dehydrogenase [Sediminispirochaetaceae bacterium]
MRELELHLPTKVYSSHSALSNLNDSCFSGGRRILLVTNDSLQGGNALKMIRETADDRGIDLIIEPEVNPFSTDEVVDKLREIARISYVEGVIGFGDVTALSVARAVAVLHKTVHNTTDLSSETSTGVPSLPYVEIPAAYGSPFFFNGGLVLSDRYDRTARFIFLKDFTPDAFIQDPALLKDFSRKYRIASLLETLLLAIEGYFSTDSTYFSDTLLLRGIGLAIDTLPGVLERSDDGEVVFKAQQASFFTAYGYAMSSPGWGTASAYILGSLLRVPASIVATVLLPYVLEYGLRACPEKVARMGNMLGENLRGLSVVAAADRVVESIRASLGVEQLPGRLSELGVQDTHLSQTVSKVMDVPFMSSLPGPVGPPELFSYLESAL